ncbi:MAG: permease [Rhodoferax sp.]
MTAHPSTRRGQHAAWGVALFLLVAVIGLFYVKWSPYYSRAFTAAETHSIGHSILTGGSHAPPAPSLRAALDYAVVYGAAIWKALVLGLLLGSALDVLVPRQWVTRLLGGTGVGSVVIGGLLSVPSMMCTCCSAPLITGLRQCRAAPGSTVAYWLGNTMLNPATLVFTGFVLGWRWVGLRLAVGIVMVIGLGWVINRMSRAQDDSTVDAAAAQALQAAAGGDEEPDPRPVWQRWLRSLAGMTLRLLPEYAILVLLLGAARAWLFPSADISVENSLLWIVGLAVAGTLFVIPTAGEVPIVQAMLSLGMAAGPAAALLVTLPPISLPSLAMVAKAFRPVELAVLVAGVIGLGALAGGLAVLLGF